MIKATCLLALPVLLLAGTVSAQPDRAPYTVAETGQRFGALQEAVNFIGDRAGTILIAPGAYRDCAVQTAGQVAFVAQEPGQTVFDGAICEGKATLVVRGRSARVEGLVFQNLRIGEGNGAGIRLEKGDLTVRQSWFRDSDQGILSADDPNGQVLIEKSTFSRLGRCDRGLSCAHSVYFGDYGSVTIRNVRFEQGRGGHYVKSRAARIEVSDSSFDDSQGRATNYMIDLSAGATGAIRGNWMVQGQDKENYSAFITNAAEGRVHSADGLVIEANVARLAPGVDRTTAFVADWSGDAIRLGANQTGPGLKKFERR
ncbi:right-handed parallel beta-helix repeat-containing protein [Novosphingobium cyanobacteriorum]|uniref:Right-handed parallel beta-helix repeat-containing protein n=1 Tax=Novosphingobium cyanobacteriorum TaxID=3024215 RepID=A0ABT6CGV0_9SPHN|nr:right-handed parallel beta-helix repeat-containing protein [Novosphingobium cyanobacteriorum]MDF8333155.1 right-handed parallel beta-helix repeat-containing protein [Novosphingobium cyanobacteriorum]